MTPRELLCLHATCQDLQFLNPVRNRLVRVLGPRVQCCEFGNQHTCAQAQLALRKADEKVVVIMAHGAASYIRSGEYMSRLTGEQEGGRDFISAADLSFFEGKAVFCLSCDSNGLAVGSLKAGAHAFVGFDDIPFNHFDEDGNPVGTAEFVSHSQRLLAAAVVAMLGQFIDGKLSLDEAVGFLRFWICRDTVRFVREEKGVAKRREIAALLLRLKDGVRFHGRTGIRFGP